MRYFLAVALASNYSWVSTNCAKPPPPPASRERLTNWFLPEQIFWTHSATQFSSLLSPVHLQQVMFEHKHATNCPIIFILWYVQFHSKNKLFNYAWITTGSWGMKNLSRYIQVSHTKANPWLYTTDISRVHSGILNIMTVLHQYALVAPHSFKNLHLLQTLKNRVLCVVGNETTCYWPDWPE